MYYLDNLPPDYSPVSDPNQIFRSEPDIDEPELENPELFQQYAKLIEERDEIEEAIKVIGARLKGQLEKQNLDKAFLAGHGTFSIVTVPRYKYSEAIEQAEEIIKIKKENERKTGIAIAQPTSSLRFTKEK